MFKVEIYKKISLFQKLTVKNCLEKYQHLIKWTEHANILDMGCGEGSVTVELLNPLIVKNVKEFNIVAVDLKDDMLSFAKETYSHLNIDFQKLDITCEEIDKRFENKFHNVFSFFCLHLITDLKWIENLHLMMKPGGQAFLLIATKNPVFASVIEFCQKGKYVDYVKKVESVFQSPFTQLSKPDVWITSLMKKQGFKNIEHHSFIQDHVYPNFNNLREFIRSFGFLVDTIPEEKQSDFLDDMTKSIIKKSRIEEGGDEIYAQCGLLLIVVDK